jgi:hypothetical protein
MGPVPEGGIQQLGRAPTPLALLACYLAHGHQRRVNAKPTAPRSPHGEEERNRSTCSLASSAHASACTSPTGGSSNLPSWGPTSGPHAGRHAIQHFYYERVAQIHARRCWRDRDIAEAHRSAIARFVDWLRNRAGPVRTGVRGASVTCSISRSAALVRLHSEGTGTHNWYPITR